MRFTENFTYEERRMLAEAVWKRQRSFIAGDRQFKEYEKLLNEILEGIDYIPGSIV
tara:strand:+ start:175 stop:342 length:168 start_codon:yes stop_codon:yes gene_type:complete